MNLFLKKKIIIFIFISLISFILFRSRLGSDDLEVFNLVYSFLNSHLNFYDFFYELRKNNMGLSNYNDLQKPTFNTLNHRFVWVLQSFIITKLVLLFNSVSKIDLYFLAQYFCGYILTFYTVLSFYLTYIFFIKNNIGKVKSLFLCFILFLGTGLISFFTGSYIESLILLLFVIRLTSNNSILKFFSDLLICLVKPYYLVVLLFLKLSENNYKKILYLFSYFFFITVFYFIIKFSLLNFSISSGKTSVSIFYPNYDIIFVIKNLYNFYFSLGIGVVFTAPAIIILIIFGNKKNQTFFKILGIFFLSIFLCLWEGFHGYAPGGRYFLPCLIIFIPEIISGYKKIISLKNNKIFNMLTFIFFILILVNIPTLEYRNTNLNSYINNSANNNSSLSPVYFNDRNEMKLKYTPIDNLEYHHIFFSNKVLLYKISGKDNLTISNYTVKVSNIYPMTAFARLIFIKNSNLKLYGNNIFLYSNKFYLYILIFYSLFLICLIFLIFLSFIYSIKRSW
jgi:hypothetical protein